MIKYFQYTDRRIARYRSTYPFYAELRDALYVEQLGSGVSVLSGNFMPPYDYMKGSERFVDVRLALWCFENGVTPLCLPRAQAWIKQMEIEDSIYRSFTLSDPQNVADEIWRFAFKVPHSGEIAQLATKCPDGR